MDATFIALQRALAGEYSLEREIGRGGMGIVYLAREVQLDRLVAIKVLPAELAARDDVRERFTREARTAAGLSHPNIVPIHRVGEAEGLPYFVMTYVRGETLGERLRARGPLTPASLSRVLHDVALALGYAHGRGVIHRDVKPDNILLEEESGRALVSDFGIAHTKRAGNAAQGDIVGTLQFMSPEQVRGEPLDGRSDIYALGVVAFLAATGYLPRDLTMPGGVPGGIARVIDRCLAADAAGRFRTAEEIASALDATATPVRAAIPEVIRDWTSSPAPLLHVYGFWSAGWFVATVSQYLRWVTGPAWPYDRHAGTNAAFGLALTVLPLIPLAAFQLSKTRRALAAGYSLADLRAALREWTTRRREELGKAKESIWARLFREATWFSAAAGSTMIITLDTIQPRPFVPESVRLGVMGAVLLGIGSLTILGALGAPLISPKVERPLVGTLRARLWNSRLGAWLASRLTPRERGIPETQFRPTELALKLAVEDLYAALPQTYREMIGDVAPVASRLSDHVTELRREVERLEVLRASAREHEEATVDDLLVASRKQLGQSVGALERMRLELLRLHGGAQDLRPLTTSLDLARAMVEDIVRLRAAESEISPGRRALPIDVRTPSPA
jgi:eukaryotic-like serine/threonine-protein kinase